ESPHQTTATAPARDPSSVHSHRASPRTRRCPTAPTRLRQPARSRHSLKLATPRTHSRGKAIPPLPLSRTRLASTPHGPALVPSHPSSTHPVAHALKHPAPPSVHSGSPDHSRHYHESPRRHAPTAPTCRSNHDS